MDKIFLFEFIHLVRRHRGLKDIAYYGASTLSIHLLQSILASLLSEPYCLLICSLSYVLAVSIRQSINYLLIVLGGNQ